MTCERPDRHAVDALMPGWEAQAGPTAIASTRVEIMVIVIRFMLYKLSGFIELALALTNCTSQHECLPTGREQFSCSVCCAGGIHRHYTILPLAQYMRDKYRCGRKT